jgi:hypothetical protein
MTLAVAPERSLEREYIRDAEGQFADVPGVPILGDKLKGAGRIDLQPGERLLRSDRISGEGGRAWLAVTEKDGNRSLRIGLGNAVFGTRHDHGGPWSAGPDRTAELDEERAERRALAEDLEDQIDDLEADPDADPVLLAELRAQLEEYEDAGSDVAELPGGYTAVLDENSARRLRETLAKALDDGEKLQAELDKPYQELDRLTLQRDKLKRKALGRKFTVEEDAEWDRLTAEISRAESELDPLSGPERPETGYWTLAEGSIPGQWADVHYDIYLDDPDVGVEVKLGAVPHGSDMDFDDMRGAEMTASFAMAEADEFVRLLAKMEKADRSPEGVTRVHNGTRSLEALSSPAVQLMMYARMLEAEDSFLRKGQRISVNRGKGGKFARKIGDDIGEAAEKVARGVRPRDATRVEWRGSDGGISRGTIVSRNTIAARVKWDKSDRVERVPFTDKNVTWLGDDGGESSANAPVDTTKPRRSAVAKAMASGDTNALDGFGREALRREARSRGIDVPRGAHEDVIKDMLWDHENAPSGRASDDSDRGDAIAGMSDLWEKRRMQREQSVAERPRRGRAPAEPFAPPVIGSDRPQLNREQADAISGTEDVFAKLRQRQEQGPEVEANSYFAQFAAGHKAREQADREKAQAKKAKPAKSDMGSVLSVLRDKKAAPVSGDRDAVDETLKALSHKELDEVAREFGLGDFVRGTREQKHRTLVENLVGSRLDRDAMMRVDLGSPLGPNRNELPPPPADAPDWMRKAYDAQQASHASKSNQPTTDWMQRAAAGDMMWSDTEPKAPRRRISRAGTSKQTPAAAPAAPAEAPQSGSDWMERSAKGQMMWGKDTPATSPAASGGAGTSSIGGRLATATTRDEARSALVGLKVAELKAVAADLGMRGVGSLSKNDLLASIVEFTVGNRINSAAIRQL